MPIAANCIWWALKSAEWDGIRFFVLPKNVYFGSREFPVDSRCDKTLNTTVACSCHNRDGPRENESTLEKTTYVLQVQKWMGNEGRGTYHQKLPWKLPLTQSLRRVEKGKKGAKGCNARNGIIGAVAGMLRSLWCTTTHVQVQRMSSKRGKFHRKRNTHCQDKLGLPGTTWECGGVFGVGPPTSKLSKYLMWAASPAAVMSYCSSCEA